MPKEIGANAQRHAAAVRIVQVERIAHHPATLDVDVPAGLANGDAFGLAGLDDDGDARLTHVLPIGSDQVLTALARVGFEDVQAVVVGERFDAEAVLTRKVG